jgi:hypothetical protein
MSDGRMLRAMFTGAGHQRQRRQEMLAELAVGVPRLAFAVGFEGQRIDQHRSMAAKLDVEGAGILEGLAARQGALLDLERC